MASSGTLIASISGIRGIYGDSLDPEVLVRYAAAFATWCRKRSDRSVPRVVIGRDGRVTGTVCTDLVAATLQSVGCTVVHAGMASTPTVEMAVLAEEADAGIVISASHNPPEWNALKLLNERGEFLSAAQGKAVMQLADEENFSYVGYDSIGDVRSNDFLPYHIEQITALPFIDTERIGEQQFTVVVDGVNSVGGVAIPRLLEALRLSSDNIIELNCEPTGRFAHPAEPLPDHLTELREAVPAAGADLGIAVDPDADRLALVDENGTYVSEELTQVIAADFLWRFRSGPFVTNLSSSRAIEDVAERHGMTVHRSAVGEINVVEKMHEVSAVLGGEGNGGVILPDLHYGRDSLVGTAMVLQHLANEQVTLSELRAELPDYTIVKRKLPLDGLDTRALLADIEQAYADEKLSTVDGLKIDFDEGWVHMRPSNTEPVLRIYAEAQSESVANELAERFQQEIRKVAGAAKA